MRPPAAISSSAPLNCHHQPQTLSIPPPHTKAYAASPSPGGAVASAPDCPNPCYLVSSYSPFRSCKAECNQDVCKRSEFWRGG